MTRTEAKHVFSFLSGTRKVPDKLWHKAIQEWKKSSYTYMSDWLLDIIERKEQ